MTADGAQFDYADAADAIAFIATTATVPLDGLKLVLVLETDQHDDVAHDITVRARSSESTDTGITLPGVKLPNVPSASLRCAPIVLGLDGMVMTYRHDVVFEVLSDGVLLTEIPVSVRPIKDVARVVFHTFLQDEQGVSGDARYMSTRLAFELGDETGFGGHHVVGLAQRPGQDFSVDPLAVTLPAGYERLAASYDFVVKAHAAYDAAARQMFGGTLPTGSTIMMSNNVMQMVPQVADVTLIPMEPTAGGW